MEGEEEDKATLTERRDREASKEKGRESQRKEGGKMEENKDERLILGGSGVLEECERICSLQFCLQEVLLKFHRWLHSQKGFLLHFSEAHKLAIPSFMCGKL